MTALPETSELLAFVRAVDLGSLSAAARDLDQPRVTVSRRIDRLEEALGVRLLHRTTRRLRLTDAGEAVYTHARAAVEAALNAQRAVAAADGAVRGLLRVAVPLGAMFSRMIDAFLRAFPEVQVEVHASAEAIDLTDRRYDLAIRAGASPDPGLVSRLLRRTVLAAFASSELLRRHPVPDLAALALAPCLCPFDHDRGRVDWPLRAGGTVRVRRVFAANELLYLRDLAVGGHGVALLPDVLAAPAVGVGALVPVLPDLVGAETRIALVYPDRELQPPVVRAFIEHVLRWSDAGFEGAVPALRGG